MARSRSEFPRGRIPKQEMPKERRAEKRVKDEAPKHDLHGGLPEYPFDARRKGSRKEDY
jgi:hypothetical protein